MTTDAEHLFLTGGTGFLGRRLLRLWLERTTARITLLVRGRPGTALAARLGIAPDTLAGRLRFVQGDLAAPRLGLTPDDTAALAADVTHIVHAGAELRFDLDLDRARRTNTAGTAAVLDLARRCARLERLDHVGTAYVAGNREGIVREGARRGDERHNNSYERSKYEAELLVRQAMTDIPAAILLPTIVTCDLETGYAPATSAFYRLLRAVATGDLRVLPGQPDNRLDMVPVDYVVAAAFAIGRRADLAGRAFHLGAGTDRLVSLGELCELACAAFGHDGVEILAPEDFARWAAEARRARPERRAFLDELMLYAPYLGAQPVFDDANTRRALDGSVGLAPRVPEYFERVAAHVRRTLSGGAP